LTGGPGCGKTTATRVLVNCSRPWAEGAAGRPHRPGRPAHDGGDRQEAKTIHRLLEWQPPGFKKMKTSPLETDFLIVDECSMLDISLTAALLKAVPDRSQVLFIGDADQLPSVGAGNVLQDLIASRTVPVTG
jgi:exodeoxyribonuclease V alpha subunit